MNATRPPPVPTPLQKKSGMPTWAIVLIVLGIVGVVGIAIIGMLAAIAIPNFVKARETAQINACINYLRMIDAAKQQWALENKKESTDTPTESEVVAYLKTGLFPVCPADGNYRINTVGGSTTCSIPKHQLPSTETVSPTKAILEGNVYRNYFFNFQLRIPGGWTVANKQDFDKALQLQPSNQKSDSQTAKAEVVEHMLLFALETPFGTPAESNPSIVLMTVDARSEQNVRDGKEIALLVAKSWKQRGDNRKQLNEPFLATLGSKDFYRMDVSVGVSDRTQHQAFFATIEKNHALFLSVTADSEADVNQILTLAGFPQTKH